MTEIAREIGATAASINYYFGSKENLMEATMLRLMELLKQASILRLKVAKTPMNRLLAITNANFDDSLFSQEHCSVWLQFWSQAPHSEKLSRLHRINRSRVRSHYRAELKHLLPSQTRETARKALQAYIDGVWVEASQSGDELVPNEMREEACRVVKLLLNNEMR